MTNDEIRALAAFAILIMFLVPWLVSTMSSAVKLGILIVLTATVVGTTITGLVFVGLHYLGMPIW